MDNVETKLVESSFNSGEGIYFSVEQIANDMEAFGWSVSSKDVVRTKGHRLRYIMIRDNNLPNIQKIRNLENEFEEARNNLKPYNKADSFTAFLLLLAFVVPGILYITFKCVKKHSVKTNNLEISKKMNEIKSQSRALLAN